MATAADSARRKTHQHFGERPCSMTPAVVLIDERTGGVRQGRTKKGESNPTGASSVLPEKEGRGGSCAASPASRNFCRAPVPATGLQAQKTRRSDRFSCANLRRADARGLESNCRATLRIAAAPNKKNVRPNGRRYAVKPSSLIGSLRMRWPQAAKIALHTAGATGGRAGSPRPVGGKSLSMKCTSTAGACAMRNNR